MNVLLDKVTLVIPTYNRPEYLKRILNYYFPAGIHIVVCDSSKDASALAQTNRLTYLHTPEMSMTEKINLALAFVLTPFVFMCPDDDFIFIDSIAEGVDVLEKNANISSFQGVYFSYTNGEELKFNPMYLNSIGWDSFSDTAAGRFNAFYSNYHQLQYSLHRTQILKDAYGLLDSLKIRNYNLQELLVATVSLINGNNCNSLIIYGVRESAIRAIVSYGTVTPNINQMLLSEEGRKERKLFIDGLASYLATKTHQTKEVSRQIIEDAVDVYTAGIEKPEFSSEIAYQNRYLNLIDFRLAKYIGKKGAIAMKKIIIGRFYIPEHDFAYKFLYNKVGSLNFKRINSSLGKVSRFLVNQERV
jgi:glycosyltransferase domain-containing protein